jgi:hypothetical protein
LYSQVAAINRLIAEPVSFDRFHEMTVQSNAPVSAISSSFRASGRSSNGVTPLIPSSANSATSSTSFFAAHSRIAWSWFSIVFFAACASVLTWRRLLRWSSCCPSSS